MRLYDFSLAPNPRRVRMFLAEKQIEVPLVQINTREREQFSDEFKAVSPGSVVPALQLDDGTCITESVAICRYFEELHPQPPLFGGDAKDRALVEMWNRRVELEGYLRIADALRNSAPMFADRALPGASGGVPQIPELAERGRRMTAQFYNMLDDRLASCQFIAGEQFSIADITAFVAIEFAQRAELSPPESCTHLARWHAEVGRRPSAKA